jgi:hydrogenase 3 maturation protease
MNSQTGTRKNARSFAEITRLLRDSLDGTEKLAILGVGSSLKGDDAAGSEIAGRFINEYSEECSQRLRVYSCSTAPENYTGAIKEFRPDHVMIIDAANASQEPGSVFLIDPEKISEVSFSTHTLPLKFLIDYIKSETGCNVTVIGIQPLDVTFGAPMSLKVRKAATDTKTLWSPFSKRRGFWDNKYRQVIY